MKWISVFLLPFLVSCAFLDGISRLGADLDLGLGGLLAEAVDVRLTAHVALERTGYEKPGVAAAGAPDRGFL